MEAATNNVRTALERSLFRPMYRARRALARAACGLEERVEEYVARFLCVHDRSPGDLICAYERFLDRYMRDVDHFARTGEYPAQTHGSAVPMDRWEYDAALLMSVLVTEHRFRIMELVAGQRIPYGQVAVVGVGAGLELELLDAPGCRLHGWDVALSERIPDLHPRAKLHRAAFPRGVTRTFDAIFLIELLEHVGEPYELLERCVRRLAPGGRIVLTTATNIPQFDHLYNFPRDHAAFRARVRAAGLRVLVEEDIPHRALATDVGSGNRFFVLTGD